MSVVFSCVSPRVAKIVRLIETEFREMPGTRLTEAQVRRLWNISTADCAAALAHLCESGSLVRDLDGRYLRPPIER